MYLIGLFLSVALSIFCSNERGKLRAGIHSELGGPAELFARAAFAFAFLSCIVAGLCTAYLLPSTWSPVGLLTSLVLLIIGNQVSLRAYDRVAPKGPLGIPLHPPPAH